MKFPPSIPIYGDTNYRNKKCPTESAEQITFFKLLRAHYPQYGSIAIHPRNEGKRSYNQTSRQKAEGMTKGASDIIIPARITFVCELKRQDHTLCSWQEGQVEYLEACKSTGAFVCVALGYEAAFDAFKKWSNQLSKLKVI